MLQGLYAAASGMEAQQAQLDAVSNDLANVDTPGYQGTEIGFQDLLYTTGGSAQGSFVATGAGSAATLAGRSQTQGAIHTTGRSLDVAINGPGYIEVRRADGTIGLTRDGALQIDAKGQLTSSTGAPLVPAITLPRGTDASKLNIASDGTVRDGGRRLGKITLADVPAPDGLISGGDSTFSATAASGAVRRATGATLKQGSLEGSNVDMAAAMGEMMTAQRGYQMASQAIHYQDQMLQIANEIKK